jgi:hypothetical protein
MHESEHEALRHYNQVMGLCGVGFRLNCLAYRIRAVLVLDEIAVGACGRRGFQCSLFNLSVKIKGTRRSRL